MSQKKNLKVSSSVGIDKDLLVVGPKRYKRLLETVSEGNTLTRYLNLKFLFKFLFWATVIYRKAAIIQKKCPVSRVEYFPFFL